MPRILVKEWLILSQDNGDPNRETEVVVDSLRGGESDHPDGFCQDCP